MRPPHFPLVSDAITRLFLVRLSCIIIYCVFFNPIHSFPHWPLRFLDVTMTTFLFPYSPFQRHIRWLTRGSQLRNVTIAIGTICKERTSQANHPFPADRSGWPCSSIRKNPSDLSHPNNKNCLLMPVGEDFKMSNRTIQLWWCKIKGPNRADCYSNCFLFEIIRAILNSLPLCVSLAVGFLLQLQTVNKLIKSVTRVFLGFFIFYSNWNRFVFCCMV